MNVRRSLVVILVALCVASACAVLLQGRQLSNLRDERARLAAASAAPPDIRDTANEPLPEAPAGAVPSPRLLQLRSEISQLTVRKRELEGERAENTRLHAALDARGTNAGASFFPPGYIRSREAQWAGTDTPEHALQSFLWAFRNGDMKNVLQVLTPEEGQELMQSFNVHSNEFFKAASAMPGMRIVEQETQPDGSVKAQVEIIPGQETQPVHFRLINGQWRMEMK